jgi:FixJ family two-component response regulator
MSGRALAQELARMRPTVKILYMSGYTDNAFVHNGVVDEGTHFIGKPFSATDLARKVREVLDVVIDDIPEVNEQAVNTDAKR